MAHRPVVYVETGDLAASLAPRCGAAVLQGPLDEAQWTQVLEGDSAP